MPRAEKGRKTPVERTVTKQAARDEQEVRQAADLHRIFMLSQQQQRTARPSPGKDI